MKSGFTLIEMMVVILLVSLVATIVRMNSSFLSSYIIRAQIEQLFSMCHHARQSALAYNRTESIEFDTQANTYRWAGSVRQLPRGIRFGYLPGTKGPPANPTTLLDKPITFAGDHITCYPDGIIQSGTVYLVDDNATMMYAISNAVSAVSYLRIYVYRDGWKLVQ